VTDFRKIAGNYVKSWFILDALSIVPLDYFISIGGTSNFNSIFRFAKFGKVYKIVRLTRLIKFIKLLKKNGGILQQVSETLKINNGMERLIIFIFLFAIFVHVMSCMYIVLA
jgi:hypothetical protein